MSDPSAIVQAAPIVADLSPFVNAAASALATALVGLAFALLAKYLGVQLGPDVQAKLAQAADDLVAAEAAKVEGNLGTKAFSVGSPMVASMVSSLAAAEPAIVAKLGLTPDKLSAVILAAVGRYQQPAVATSVASK